MGRDELFRTVKALDMANRAAAVRKEQEAVDICFQRRTRNYGKKGTKADAHQQQLSDDSDQETSPCPSDEDKKKTQGRVKNAGKGPLKNTKKIRGKVKESTVITIESTDDEAEEQEGGIQERRTRAAAAKRTFAVSRRCKASVPDPESKAATQPSEKPCSSEDGSDEDGEEPSAQDAQIALKATRKRSILELISGKFDEETLKRLVRDQPDNKNFSLKSQLVAKLHAQGPKWRFQLRSAYNVLLYGFGSKRAILEHFAREVLTDGAVVIVNGFNPAVTAKHVVLAAASAIVPYSLKGSSAAVILDQIKRVPEDPSRHVYIIIHNIDGLGLRESSEQAVLAELASCSGVHIAASIDHINAPLLWDMKTREKFKWLCHDATTFSPYLAETMDVQPVLMARFHETSRRGATTALTSMAPTAQAVFKVMVESQLDDPSSPGITFPTLFRMCRERWLVSSEQALRGFLTEFHDHELLAERMAAIDGGEQREVLFIPLEEETLRKLLEEMSAQMQA
ncbi:hypothetical protein CEUSTIGMA_g209.t1 [Chlamydomonas eustigma]|uniref:Origin recognition complex subunit 2 n=1 Tax=Chlamydomonas eustigma TaxID=1157962 RepID=A0A250WPK7_9CHLO|nr:hypothetical protein CEUSTIGMA_g209.t1 [Chlamydomonas eustigma]|eukprot:GAX72753.1 hypothetical protein CEUSTIGMA_g209.t1 [Chlamydomonas eustigma]